jgi:tetratricopeptide (TPR) repeat protein
LNPHLADAWYLQGLIARQASQPDVAIHAFQQCLAINPDNPEALFILGQELQRKGDVQGAQQSWEKAISLRPQYGQALYNLSRLIAKNDPARSEQLRHQFERVQAEQHISDRAQTLGNFALASANAHDWPQAVSQLKEAIQVCGQCSALAQLHKDLGLIYCRSGSLHEGRSELLEAQKLTPGDKDVAQALRMLSQGKKSD